MADVEHSSITKADSHPPADHASEHTDGTDDIQSATGSQKGLATAAQITKLNGIATAATDDTTVNAHIADTTDAHDASAISFAPAGTIAATSVQAAIEEAASEGGGGGASIAVEEDGTQEGTGIDRFDFTTGLNLSVSGSQATVSADETNLNNHISDASDAHDASAISFSPAGTIAATTVQAAIEEAASEGGGGSGYRTLVTLGSDESVTTTAFADISGLSFAVVSGTVYRFEAFILFTAATTGTGGNFSVNGPASPTFLAYHVQFGAGSSTAVTTSNRSAYNAGAAGAGTDSGGNFAYVRGIVAPSASGTFYISFATETAASAVTAKAGSTLEYW